MTETLDVTVKTECSGGFCIEAGPSSLRVTAQDAVWGPKNMSTGARPRLILYCGFLVGILVLYLIGRSGDLGMWAFFVGALFVSELVLWSLFRRVNNIYCTHEEIQVIRILRGKTIAIQSFKTVEIDPICYKSLSYTGSRESFGLVFKFQSKEVRVLAGLRIVEAQKTLAELERLGYRTIKDVGMPMAVEMELERRRFGLN